MAGVDDAYCYGVGESLRGVVQKRNAEGVATVATPQLPHSIPPMKGGKLLYLLETKARRGDGEYGRLYEGAEAEQPRYPWPLPALSHWEVKVGGTSMKDVGGDDDVYGRCCHSRRSLRPPHSG